jgi:hypothetical protein
MNGDIGKIRKKYNRRKKKEGEVKKKQSTNTEYRYMMHTDTVRSQYKNH